MTEFYTEPAKKLPIVKKADVIVAGAGPAGFAAAYSAAKNGADTILIEALGNVGGVSTSGLMSHWTGTANSKVYYEILDQCAKKIGCETTITIDPEILKTVYLEMLDDVGCAVRLYTTVSDVITENGCVKGVITESKSGREVILADAIIDASGDGDIAAKAGVPFIKGREEDGKMQPATLMFKVAGVDTDRAVFPGSFETTVDTSKGELQALARKILPAPAGHVLLYRTTLPGVVTCNMTNCIDIDGTNTDDLTKATIICRKQIPEIVKFLREYAPGYENCYVISSASLIGIRETRHFEGEYTITEEDICTARVFDDYVVKDAYFNFDVHNITGAGLDKTGVQHKFKQKKGYTIPYRCLLPKSIDGLLLCGRNISGTHMAHSNFRAMPICAAIGEAAGAAAAIAVNKNIPVRNVTAEEIQKLIF